MKKRVGYQGTLGSFSHIASLKLFPEEELINFISFHDVIKNVRSGKLDFGVLPIENSTSGEVGMVLDELFHNDGVYVVNTYELPVVQNLVAKKNTSLSDIKKVYSHEQALMQCSNYLSENNFEIESYANTALAAKMVSESEDTTIAAIASLDTALLYDLKVLKPNISNLAYNHTRFVIISKEFEKTGDEFSFVFTVIDGSGALATILSLIAQEEINLLSIKSRSIKDTPWKYYFYCEAEGNVEDSNAKRLEKALNTKCETFKYLGCYKDIK